MTATPPSPPSPPASPAPSSPSAARAPGTAAPPPLSGRTAIVTGASRGIGRAIALGLATAGAQVVLGYRTRYEQAQQVVDTVVAGGGQASAVAGDLSCETAVLELFDEAERRFGGIDIVVANAGTTIVKSFVDYTEADFDALVSANTKSAFLTVREAARRVRDGGRILATSSGGTRMWFTQTGLYVGTKAAVEQFVRILALELGDRGITANAVSPGFTDTDLLPDRERGFAADMSPLHRLGLPGDIADVVVFLAGEGGRWVTGQNIVVSGGVC